VTKRKEAIVLESGAEKTGSRARYSPEYQSFTGDEDVLGNIDAVRITWRKLTRKDYGNAVAATIEVMIHPARSLAAGRVESHSISDLAEYRVV